MQQQRGTVSTPGTPGSRRVLQNSVKKKKPVPVKPGVGISGIPSHVRQALCSPGISTHVRQALHANRWGPQMVEEEVEEEKESDELELHSDAWKMLIKGGHLPDSRNQSTAKPKKLKSALRRRHCQLKDHGHVNSKQVRSNNKTD